MLPKSLLYIPTRSTDPLEITLHIEHFLESLGNVTWTNKVKNLTAGGMSQFKEQEHELIDITMLPVNELLKAYSNIGNFSTSLEKEDHIYVSVVVTQYGRVFDAGETSQDRMVRAIVISGITGSGFINWKLADNSIVEITIDELKEALTLAGQKMSKIWLEN